MIQINKNKLRIGLQVMGYAGQDGFRHAMHRGHDGPTGCHSGSPDLAVVSCPLNWRDQKALEARAG